MNYTELQTTTNFSFLRGASHPDELVRTAKELGHAAIGIADRNTLAGVVRAHLAAKEVGLKLLVGARLDFADETSSILCYPKNRTAYGRLANLLTIGKRRAPKGQCELHASDLPLLGEDQILVVIPGLTRNLEHTDAFGLDSSFRWNDNKIYLAASILFDGQDAKRLHQIAQLSAQYDIPMVATNDVHAHSPERRPLQDVLTCIREHCTIQTAGFRLHQNAERYLKSAQEMARIFRDYPEAIQNTVRIADQIQFSLDELRYEYPDLTDVSLADLTWAGAKERYPDGVPQKVIGQIEYELKLVEELNYAPYFLTVHDIVSFAKKQGILYQGRGSAANSVICYCLGITAVDPTKIDVLFERFVSKDRDEPPDIDVDFEHERREEVIQYIYERYGRDKAGIAATVITYRKRSAVREVGKALGFSLQDVEAVIGELKGYSLEDIVIPGLTRNLDHKDGFSSTDDRQNQSPALDSSFRWNDKSPWFKLARELLSFPRHLGQHVGGFVLTRGLLCEMVPICNAAMQDRTFIEWDKDDLERLGMLKVDILGLGMLSCIRRSFALLKEHYDLDYNLATIPKEDPKTYDMICAADTVGVFQIESRAQMSMLPRLKPRCYYDLVIEVAIVRPGPIQGGMVHPYLRRRSGQEAVSYPSKELEAVLGKTLGVPLFQEQAMRIAVVAAGFTPGESDGLRRAMATFKRTGLIYQFRDKFINGMVQNGYAQDFAESCYQQILGFGEYGFPESHAASFAHLVYVSAWLKCHYPEVFACALLNSQPMGFYAPSQIISDASRHGVKTLPVDVNHSFWDYTLESVIPGSTRNLEHRNRFSATDNRQKQPPALDSGFRRNDNEIRTGLCAIKSLRQDEAEWIVACRGNGYRSLEDLVRRSGISKATVECLTRSDALNSLELDRQHGTWEALAVDYKPLPLFPALTLPSPAEQEREILLPHLHQLEEVIRDYQFVGFSLRNHPIGFLRQKLIQAGYSTHADLKNLPSGHPVKIAGLVIIRQRPPTAKGVTFQTLEDESGFANIVIWPKVFEKFRHETLSGSIIAVLGKLQKQDGVVHVVAEKLHDLSHHWQSLRIQSRDFR